MKERIEEAKHKGERKKIQKIRKVSGEGRMERKNLLNSGRKQVYKKQNRKIKEEQGEERKAIKDPRC